MDSFMIQSKIELGLFSEGGILAGSRLGGDEGTLYFWIIKNRNT